MGEPGLKRGDLVISVLSRDYGKGRPAVVVQSDLLVDLDSVILCPLTSDLANFGPMRIRVEATEATGLESPSLIMVDKITAVSRSRCKARIGRLENAEILALDRILIGILGLALAP